MRIVLFGSGGQLGWELARTLPVLGQVAAYNHQQLDLCSFQQVQDILNQNKPHVIINAAAYNAVDQAESETKQAMLLNTSVPGFLAESAQQLKSALIHFSTDYVFDGEKSDPYSETDQTNPINVYGKSKLTGEQSILRTGCACWIFRTSWVYSLRRSSFIGKILQWARTQQVLRIVTDQTGSPTWSRMLAEITTQALAQGKNNPVSWIQQTNGIFHLAGQGSATRMEVAQAALSFDPCSQEHHYESLEPALSSDFPTAAQRPANSALNCSLFARTFGLELPDWKIALKLAMEEKNC